MIIRHGYVVCSLLLVRIISAVTSTSNERIFRSGTDVSYKLDNTVLIYDSNSSIDNDNTKIGYKIIGQVALSTIWEDDDGDVHKLLNIEVSDLQLKTISSKRNPNEDFKTRKSRISGIQSCGSLVHLKNGIVQSVYADPAEDKLLLNLKKAVCDLLQFQLKEGYREEDDLSGRCQTEYKITNGGGVINKRKIKCSADDICIRKHKEKILDARIESNRNVTYTLDSTRSYFAKINSYEIHTILVNVDNNVQAAVTNNLNLNFRAFSQSAKINSSDDIKEALEKAKMKSKCNLERQNFIPDTQKETRGSTKSLQRLVKEHRDDLKEEALGTMKQASSFLNILKIMRNSTEDDITKIIKNSKNKQILNQLMDIVGSSQTIESHRAVRKSLDFSVELNLDPLERYLWSLSMGCCPLKEVVEDLITVWKQRGINNKLKETLSLTFTSMIRKLEEEDSSQLSNDALKMLLGALLNCANDECVATYFRALQNLKNPSCKSVLLKYALQGSRIVSTSALKALYSLSPKNWDEGVFDAAENIYYQKKRLYDSSARTIAADIILEANPDTNTLTNMLRSLITNDSVEIQTYVLQKILQMSSVTKDYDLKVKYILKKENLYHYGVLAPRGLSNALSTTFFEHSGTNATLDSVSEIYKGTLKRFSMDISMKQHNHAFKAFSLGIFGRGLSSFMWSEKMEDGNEPDEPEQTTAGLEISVFDTHIRPFLFFSGYAELIGHLWSGTASERTPIFQIIALLLDHYQTLTLSTGDVVRFQLQAASSLEVAGKVQFSLWNRNGNSAVDIKAAVLALGSISIENSLLTSVVKLNASGEATVNYFSDLDFYDKIILCSRLVQPDLVLRYSQQKVFKINGTKYKLRRKHTRTLPIQGRTFALSQKNNDMCNDIFKD